MQQHVSYLLHCNCVGHSQLAAFSSYRQAGNVHALSMARLTAVGLLLRTADVLFYPEDNSMSTEGPQPLSPCQGCGSSNPHVYFQHSCCPISRRMFAWAGALVSGRQTKMAAARQSSWRPRPAPPSGCCQGTGCGTHAGITPHISFANIHIWYSHHIFTILSMPAPPYTCRPPQAAPPERLLLPVEQHTGSMLALDLS